MPILCYYYCLYTHYRVRNIIICGLCNTIYYCQGRNEYCWQRSALDIQYLLARVPIIVVGIFTLNYFARAKLRRPVLL